MYSTGVSLLTVKERSQLTRRLKEALLIDSSLSRFFDSYANPLIKRVVHFNLNNTAVETAVLAALYTKVFNRPPTILYSREQAAEFLTLSWQQFEYRIRIEQGW